MFKRRLALALGLLVATAALASSNGHDGHHHEEHEHVGREVRVPAEEEHSPCASLRDGEGCQPSRRRRDSLLEGLRDFHTRYEIDSGWA